MPIEAEATEQTFYHGTKADLATGDLIGPRHASNYADRSALPHVYFAATLEAAVWGAELAVGGGGGRRRAPRFDRAVLNAGGGARPLHHPLFACGSAGGPPPAVAAATGEVKEGAGRPGPVGGPRPTPSFSPPPARGSPAPGMRRSRGC